jgi:pimeloyl-ACP methyl ester carboxylesterase
MPFVESNGARIHWQAEGSGTPVLLIMGHLYSSAMWYPLVPALAKRHRVIRFDNRGTGQSDTTRGVTVEQMAADALAVLEAAGETSAHVYGVSMGGGIAAEFAMAYPERTRSVTLGCTLLKTEKTDPAAARRALVYKFPRWLVKLIFRLTVKPEGYGSNAPRDAAERDIAVLRKDRFTMAGVREQAMAIANYATTRERARAKITMPALALHGDEDKAVPVEKGREWAEILPHAKYVEYPGAGHNYLVAYNAESTREFIDFIEDVDAKGAQ